MGNKAITEVRDGWEIGHSSARHKGRRKRAGCQSGPGSQQEGQYEPPRRRKGMKVAGGRRGEGCDCSRGGSSAPANAQRNVGAGIRAQSPLLPFYLEFSMRKRFLKRSTHILCYNHYSIMAAGP